MNGCPLRARTCCRRSYDALPPHAALMEPGLSARCRPPPPHPADTAALEAAAAAAAALSFAPGAHTAPRRLAVSRAWVLERDAVTYDVEERRALG